MLGSLLWVGVHLSTVCTPCLCLFAVLTVSHGLLITNRQNRCLHVLNTVKILLYFANVVAVSEAKVLLLMLMPELSGNIH